VHELAIIEGVLDMVTERLPDATIRCVRLEVGALTGVVPDSLRFCFELATEGTSLQGACLEITETPGHDLKIASVKVT
jgi:hydrogenase nickel incorporation protein HypA/HybF